MTWLSWPNRITIARTLFIAPLTICLLNMNQPDWWFARRAALGLFVLIAVGDGLDGFLVGLTFTGGRPGEGVRDRRGTTAPLRSRLVTVACLRP